MWWCIVPNLGDSTLIQLYAPLSVAWSVVCHSGGSALSASHSAFASFPLAERRAAHIHYMLSIVDAADAAAQAQDGSTLAVAELPTLHGCRARRLFDCGRRCILAIRRRGAEACEAQ